MAKKFKQFDLSTFQRRVAVKHDAETGKSVPVVDGKEANAILVLSMSFAEFWENAEQVDLITDKDVVANATAAKQTAKREKALPEFSPR